MRRARNAETACGHQRGARRCARPSGHDGPHGYVCGSCGRLIAFATSEKNPATEIPLEQIAAAYTITDQGTAHKVGVTPVYVSHFVSCTNPERHSRGRG